MADCHAEPPTLDPARHAPVSQASGTSRFFPLPQRVEYGTIGWKRGAMSEQIVVLITASSQEEADQIANALVAEMIAACVNVVPGITSVYRWEGKVQRDAEWLLIAKSRRDVLDALVQRVQALHSYDVPEVIALPLVGGSEAYLSWLDREVHGSWHSLD
jgi:periplasmic divalent cation tolerance protein